VFPASLYNADETSLVSPSLLEAAFFVCAKMLSGSSKSGLSYSTSNTDFCGHFVGFEVRKVDISVSKHVMDREAIRATLEHGPKMNTPEKVK
jgi:hypothetical protein